ncbi:hypothetical protein PRIPAC_97303 [Pristionchus pacificus]|uniref:HLH domain-containing protein n=1 Tax=Pristionchus pacificus TaxID=54126 RepID=A0A2A6CGZ8_PRIPA|nr:hypothetical protein PRIPAC_97303 [Pristionchus pacificus]|eukprot:PDM77360.1 HLH domain-containing protein [Pristionchus pacificus]
MERLLAVAVGVLLLIAVVTPHSEYDHDHNFGEAGDVKDEAHIREHMGDKIDLPPHIEAARTRFLYFEMCDLNKDSVIDGIEILKMMSHGHEKGSSMPGNPIEDEEQFIRRIDKTLEDMDFDGNGLITYPEFSRHQEMQSTHFTSRA